MVVQHSACEGQRPPHWYADDRFGIHVPYLQKQHSSSCPSSETGKKGTCGLYMTLFLHLVLVLKVRTGQMYKDSLDKQASWRFLMYVFLFLLPIFFAQMEVEACIHLKCAESVVQREIVPMIIIVFPTKEEPTKYFPLL